jgi:poly(3-hydroxybutyrate) depolymerase
VCTQALVEDIRKDYGRVLDTKRTYVIGLSNGGIFLSTLLLDKHVRFTAACIYMGG